MGAPDGAPTTLLRTMETARRALCPAHSPVMPDAWAVAMAMGALASRLAAGLARITHSESGDVAEAMAEQGLPLMEPPPGPP